MLEDKTSQANESSNPGMRLLLEGKLDEAEEYFSVLAEQNNYLGYYGLATARFKRCELNPGREETEEIIELCKKSMAIKPDFADSYFMCGLVYEQMASLLTREYKRAPLKDGDKKVEEIKEVLKLAKDMIEKAVELNPAFKKNAESELNSYQRRLEGIDNLRRFYTNNRN